MNGKSDLINKLKRNRKTRESYLRAKLNINIPSQIRALRLRREMTQEGLAREAEMMQPRISAMERPGATKFNLDTLIRIAAAFKVGLIVKFVPFSEMLRWENGFSQDTFDVVTVDRDTAFQKEDRDDDKTAVASPGENPQIQRRELIVPVESPNQPRDLADILRPPRRPTDYDLSQIGNASY
jgi:transcriptional regulator with XRE-family HTH domain